ncbi:MAG: ATP-binding protein [Flavobacteriaceae bacterium]|nr:ATP-binding protein [Flavobacteriaceae bacterium]
MHRLLKRQLKKSNLTSEVIDAIGPLLEQVDAAYNSFDNDIEHVETILEKSSQELFQVNLQLKNNVETISSQLNKVVSNIQEIIFEIDLDGNWSYLNPAWEKLTGYKVEDSLGKPFYNFLKEVDGKSPKSLYHLEYTEDHTVQRIFKIVNNDNTIKWFDCAIKIIHNQLGETEGFIGTIVDVTSLKSAEEKLLAANRNANKANKAKNEFLSTMSHEIRTPLNAVIGFSNLLLLDDPKPEQVENINALKYSSEHLLALVNDILDFSKIDAGSLELEHTDFCLDHIINGIQSIFQNKAKEKNILFFVERNGNIPRICKGDSTRLSQIITNLVNNAIKFTEKGKVSLQINHLRETDKSIALEFKVIDTGIGIPENQIKKIFESFAQANSDTTRKYGGTGLGLAICKRLLELMETELQVESIVNHGSIFSFKLQLEKSDNINIENQIYTNDVASLKLLKGKKVLVAEDNKMNIIVIRKFLERWEMNFDIAINGKIALEKACKTNYDIILMDLQMPIMNGFDATVAIRQSNCYNNQDKPIYALSASAWIDIKNELEQFGLDGLISKPFNPSELYLILTKILAEGDIFNAS